MDEEEAEKILGKMDHIMRIMEQRFDGKEVYFAQPDIYDAVDYLSKHKDPEVTLRVKHGDKWLVVDVYVLRYGILVIATTVKDCSYFGEKWTYIPLQKILGEQP